MPHIWALAHNQCFGWRPDSWLDISLHNFPGALQTEAPLNLAVVFNKWTDLCSALLELVNGTNVPCEVAK